MPYSLTLSKVLRQAGWKVKVFDREGPETPHVTIICKTGKWRISLRTGDFLFPGGKMSDIPVELQVEIFDDKNWNEMIKYWDAHNDKNPVQSKLDEDEADKGKPAKGDKKK